MFIAPYLVVLSLNPINWITFIYRGNSDRNVIYATLS